MRLNVFRFVELVNGKIIAFVTGNDLTHNIFVHLQMELFID